jgi:hypothetical protein
MSTTVTYKGSTIATVDNNTKTLTTQGKYLEDDITLTDVSASQPNLQTKTKSYTPSETAQSENVTADSGYDGLDEVDITVGAIPSDYVGSQVPDGNILEYGLTDGTLPIVGVAKVGQAEL